MPTPHVHKEVILAFADGAQVQVQVKGGHHWKDCSFPDFDPMLAYRVKPEPAAPKWPQTTMTDAQLVKSESHIYGESASRRAIANATIAHECSTGALVPADKVREIEAKARAEGEEISKEHHRYVIWWALQDAGVFPESTYLDDLVRRIPT